MVLYGSLKIVGTTLQDFIYFVGVWNMFRGANNKLRMNYMQNIKLKGKILKILNGIWDNCKTLKLWNLKKK